MCYPGYIGRRPLCGRKTAKDVDKDVVVMQTARMVSWGDRTRYGTGSGLLDSKLGGQNDVIRRQGPRQASVPALKPFEIAHCVFRADFAPD